MSDNDAFKTIIAGMVKARGVHLQNKFVRQTLKCEFRLLKLEYANLYQQFCELIKHIQGLGLINRGKETAVDPEHALVPAPLWIPKVPFWFRD